MSKDDFIKDTKAVSLKEVKDSNKNDFSCDKCEFIAVNKVGLNLHNTLNHFQTDFIKIYF